MIRHGLCCISIELQRKKIKAQTMTWSRFSKLPLQEAYQTVHDRTLNNLNTIYQHLILCKQNGWTYRIGSDIVPLATHPSVRHPGSNFYWPFSDAIAAAEEKIRTFVRTGAVRCSMHPDQFVVPASAKPDVVDKALADLEFHAFAMDTFGLPRSYEAPINIHMNCGKGDREEIYQRFVLAWTRMSDGVRNRLVLENEDKLNSWSIKQLLKWPHDKLGIPITYDSLHHRLNPDGLSPEAACDDAYRTWGSFRPLFHYSCSANKKNPRAHADFPRGEFPPELNRFYDSLRNIDLDFELKKKDIAILRFEGLKFQK